MKGKELDETSALKIKAAAKQVFMAKGYDGATMQAIADLAGYNKAQLHYYFRSKDGLFLMIFQEELQKLIAAHAPLMLNAALPIREKLLAYIDSEAKFLSENPQLPLFLLSEFHRNPDLIHQLIGTIRLPTGAPQVLQELNQELRASGSAFALEDIMIMLRSMLIEPLLDQPISSFLFNLTPEQIVTIRERQITLAKEVVNRLLI